MIWGTTKMILPVIGILSQGICHFVDSVIEGRPIRCHWNPDQEDRPPPRFLYDRGLRAQAAQVVDQTLGIDDGRRRPLSVQDDRLAAASSTSLRWSRA
jgi:hypothetical protein